MAFNSLAYFIFLPLVYLCFYYTKDRYRWLVLLLASCGFYAALGAPLLLIVLALVTVTSYLCGISIGTSETKARRTFFFVLGSSLCILILGIMKYLPALVNQDDQPHRWLLVSIGVSYFALQAVAYLTDLYLEILEPEQHLGHHALSLAFFPKLLQGPIERAGDLLPQFKKPYQFDYAAMRSGLLLFTWGLFKKVVVADRLGLYAGTVFSDVHAYRGPVLVLATYLYALQIYFDFSGYTDMARGTARLFGINLTENFNSPYLATSIADFWRRWHISFSRWILDYLFKPLQMAWRDWGQAGTALALLITFLLSGIWHGASWGFVVWGLLHGSYLAASTYYRPVQKRLHKRLGLGKGPWLKAWQIAVTFNLVCFAWIFFRAESIGDALYVVTNLAGDFRNPEYARKLFTLLPFKTLALTVGLAAAVSLCESKVGQLPYVDFWNRATPVRWACYYLLLIGMVVLGVSAQSQFIYFKF